MSFKNLDMRTENAQLFCFFFKLDKKNHYLHFPSREKTCFLKNKEKKDIFLEEKIYFNGAACVAASVAA